MFVYFNSFHTASPILFLPIVHVFLISSYSFSYSFSTPSPCLRSPPTHFLLLFLFFLILLDDLYLLLVFFLFLFYSFSKGSLSLFLLFSPFFSSPSPCPQSPPTLFLLLF